MKHKKDIRLLHKVILFNKEEDTILKQCAKKLDTYESEVIRYALHDYYEKQGILPKQVK